jgi:hypothetical protein
MLRPQLAIEIGAYLASTTEAMARAVADNGEGELQTVDPFALQARLNIARWPAGLRKVTQFHLTDSMAYFAKLRRRGTRAGLVFIDGNHDYEFALFDIQCAARMMNPDGFIVIDNIAQPGPFMAAWHFMERAHAKGWRECGNSLGRFRPTDPFDRHRTTIHNTDFCVLRAPATMAIGADPVCIDELAWSPASKCLRLRLAAAAEGRLQVQFVIRVFEAPPREIIESTSVDIFGECEVDIAVPFPTAPDITVRGRFPLLDRLLRRPRLRQLRRSIEPWLSWEGGGELNLSEPPSIG